MSLLPDNHSDSSTASCWYDEFAASFAQQRMWFIDQLDPGSAVYNIPLLVKLEGNLSSEVLASSVNALVQRHETLRTTFVVRSGQLMQRIASAAAISLAQIDLTGQHEADRNRTIAALADREAAHAFDLSQGPLLRMSLVKAAEREYFLLLNMHHIISDGWSVGILIQELLAVYRAFLAQQPTPLPPLDVQYADFSEWEREQSQDAGLITSLAYWKAQLGGAPAHLDLPADRPRPAQLTYRGAQLPLRLSPDLSRATRLFAEQHGLTPFMVLLATFNVLLSRLTGQRDLCIGVPVAGRRLSQVEGLIGLFVNTVVMRCATDPAQDFLAHISQIKTVSLEAFEHQHVPFERLVEELKPARSLSHAPLFQTMFTLQNTSLENHSQPGLAVSRVPTNIPVSKFDLSLFFTDTDCFDGYLEYSTDLFDAATIERMADHFCTLLQAAVAAPHTPLAELPLLNAAQQRQLLIDWNDTRAPFPHTDTLASLFAQQARRSPQACAVVFEDQRLSYAQLDARANQLAHHLIALGVRTESVVALCMDRSIDLPVAMLAVLKAGAAYLPLDPSYPKDRLAFMIEDARPAVVLTHQALWQNMALSQAHCCFIDTQAALLDQQPTHAPPSSALPGNLAYVIYTSGSTGRPKGVQVLQSSVLNFLSAMARRLDLAAGQAVLNVTSLSFDIAVLELLLPLCLVGARTVLCPRHTSADPTLLAALIEREHIDLMQATPVTWRMLLQHRWPDAPHLTVLCGGEALPVDLASQLLERVPVVWNMYGPTETTVWSTMQRLTTSEPLPSLGRPIDNTQVYLMDAGLRPVPVGVTAELYIAGAGLARGYLGRPGLSAERFVPNPFAEPGARMYRTGDLARYLPDGRIEYLGRADHQLKLRGFRIEAGEIEAALLACPDIREAVVVGRQDPTGHLRLVAYVVADQQDLTPSPAWSATLARTLPEYMVPSHFVVLPSLPLTPNGKIDRQALPAPDMLRHSAAFVAPSTPLQQQLASIWAEVLGLDKVGLHDDFFALGGHSLLATQLTARLRSALAIELPLRALFENPVLADLAQHLHDLLALGSSSLAHWEPIPPVDRLQPIALSFAQQRLWFLDQLQPESPFYNMPVAMRMQGSLHVQALHQALNLLVQRHEILRTTFSSTDGAAVQTIAASLALPLPLCDLSDLPAAERQAKTAWLAQDEAQTPFSLAHGPLLRAQLLRLQPHEHVLLLTLHHIVSDGWSMGLLVRDLAALYAAQLDDARPHQLPELPIQYADFSAWQRRWLQAPAQQQQLAYWVQQLQGAPALLALPTDRPRPAAQSFRGATLDFELPAQAAAHIQALAHRHGATTFMVLAAAFNAFLWHFTGQRDLCIGTPVANRRRPEVEPLIGFFVNTLVLRTAIAPDASFSALIEQVRQTSLAAFAHQDTPFEQIVDALKVERQLSHSPLYQVMLSVQNAHMPTPELAGLQLQRLPINSGIAKFDLTLFVVPQDQRLLASFEYSTDLFDAATIERMADHFCTLLQAAVAAPHTPLAELPLLNAAQQRQLLIDWNDTRAPFPHTDTLASLFAQQARRSPQACAVVFEDQRLSYAQLDARANQLAHHLIALGVRTESVVALCMDRSIDLPVAMLAVLKAGAAYLPLDPSYPKDRLAFMIEDAQPAVLISQQHLLDVLPASGHLPLCLADDPDLRMALLRLPTSSPPALAQPHNLAYLIYTSGSTGRPKGVAIEHAGIVNRLHWMQQAYELTAQDHVLQKTPFGFDVSVWEFFWPLIQGARLVLAQPGGHQDVSYLWALIARESITTLHFVPPMLDVFLQQAPAGSLPALRQVFCSGQALPLDLQDRFLRRMRGVVLHNLYGPTEASVDVTAWHCVRQANMGSVPIGKPISNIQIHILDQRLRPVPIGVTGELHIAGIGLARGYLGRPGLSAERFVPNPFAEPGARMYRTGDLARYLPDGRIEYLGRADHQLKLRGFRIEAGEIEAALLACPDIREAVVVGRQDPTGHLRLVAYVVADQQDLTPSPAWSATLARTLPEYMVPSHFVVLPSLPLTPNGKIDRQALPAPDMLRHSAAFVAPSTPLQQQLASIWAEVLGLDKVGLHDDFFALGGHSLLATQLTARLRSALAIELPLRALFENPVLADLAQHLHDLLALGSSSLAHWEPIPPVDRLQPIALSFAQQRLWFLDQLQPESPFYNMPVAMRMQGSLHVQALHQALNLLVQRHEILRTTFSSTDGAAVQTIAASLALPLPLCDLSDLPAAERQAKTAWLAQDEAQTPFSLAHGPLLRAQLLRLQPHEHVLLLTLHHIVSDGWSMGLLVRDLAALYAAQLDDARPHQLPELPIQYADFSAWQRRWLQAPAQQQQLAYWVQQLQGAPALLALPTDRPRPAAQSFRGATLDFELPAQAAAHIQALAHRHGATTFMVLAAAFNAFLWHFTGQRDLCIGTPVANRRRPEVEPLIGFFVNTLVLRTAIAPDASFSALIEQVRQTSLAAFAHQDTPFEQIVDALKVERQLSHSPLYQVMLSVQNAHMPTPELAGLQLQRLPINSGIAKFDLTLFVVPQDQRLLASFEYSTDLFDAATIERMADHFCTLLQAAVAAPHTPLAELPLLNAAQQRQLLIDWNDTRAPFPHTDTLASLFAQQARRSPQACAVVFEDQRLSYAQLDARANQLAHHLIALGVRTESVVALCMDRSIDLPVAMLAVLKAGAAYLPLDPSYPKDRLAFMIEDAQPAVLISQQHLLDVLPASGHLPLCLADDPDLRMALLRLPTSSPPALAQPHNLAYLIYTSGSTGRPKGVAIEHRSAAALMHWARETFSAEQRAGMLACTSVCFDLSVFEIFTPLCWGGQLILARNALDFVNLADKSIVTFFNTVPSAMSELVKLGQIPSSVLVVGLAGEPLHNELVQRIYRAGVAHVFNLYGPSEDTTYSTFVRVPADSALPVTIGRPLANTRLYVLDAMMRPVPQGVAGELYIGGQGLARHYLRRPGMTASRFVPDPFGHTPGARLYRTGDLVRYRQDAQVEFLGRIDHQVKVRGYRIELGEIEATLLRHPLVRETVVIARQDLTAGATLVAYLACQDHAMASADECRAFLRRTLPEYMVPSHFVVLPSLPLTPNGKIDRQALPAPDMLRHSAAFVAPSTPLQQQLASIWAEVLGLDKVGLHDDFFALGGHSLLATQLTARLRSALAIELPLRALFENPVLADLAQHLHDLLALGSSSLAHWEPIPPVDRLQPIALSFAQQRLWFLDQLQPESPFYNMPVAMRMQGSLHVQALHQALNLLVQRHEILRTTFSSTDGAAVQTIAASLALPLPLCDLSDLPAAERQAKTAWLAQDEAQTPFSLAHGPLLRAQLLRLQPHEHVLLLTLHHIVSDGWSMGLLVRDLAALYAAQLDDARPHQLPELPIQYADFSAWQRRWLQAPAQQQQLAYWVQQLQGAPALLALPTDRPRPAAQSFRGATLDFELPAQAAAHIQALAHRHGATTFMVLAAAFNAFLWHFTGQRDLCIGTPVANRRRPEVEPLIGFFVNTLVLRTAIAPDASFSALIEQVRQTSLAAFAHQDTPFEQIVDALKVERQLSHSPLYQVMLSVQNAHMPTPELAGLQLQRLPINSGIAKFDLTLFVVPQDQRLLASFEYSTDLFDAATIERMADHFCTLLQAAVAAPHTPLAELPLLNAAQQRQLLIDWNDTRAPFPHTDTLASLFAQQARRSPQACAVVFEDQRLSYAQLDARANQLAHHLIALGVRTESVVALCMDRSIDLPVAMLAVLKAGAAYLPLDPSYPKDRLAFMIEDARPAVVLTHQALWQNMALSQAHCCFIDTQAALLDQQPTHAPPSSALPGNLAYVIYTSGSTGRPKGVQVLQSSVLNFLSAMARRLDLAAGQAVLNVTSLSFDIAVLELLLPLCLVGARTVLCPRHTSADPTLLAALIEREHIDLMQATPVTWRMLLQHRWPDAPHLTVLCGGEALPVDLASQLLERVPVVWNMYGPTETTVWSTMQRLTTSEPLPSLGRPIDNTQVYLMDAGLRPVPVGVTAELYIAGAGLARGYLGRPGLSAERFVPNPFAEPGARMYRTGDLARYLPDGRIEYLGRADDQVKLRGFRIELGEIERALVDHPAVHQAVVVARDTDAGHKALAAYVVPQPTTTQDTRLAFSLFYFGADTFSPTDKYGPYLEAARFADTHGFEALWTPERHFHEVGSLYPNPATLNAALAMVTQRIQLRAGSVVLPLHHPARVAEEWAVVDNLSNGRVGISIASGWHPRDFALAPQRFPHAERQQAMREGVDVLRQLWAGEAVTLADGTGKPVSIRTYPRPLQSNLPLWLTAAGNPDTFAYAGQVGAHLLTHLLGQSIDDLAANIRTYRDALRTHGHDPSRYKVTVMVHAFVGEEHATVLEQARAPFLAYMRAHLGLAASVARMLGIPVDDASAEDLDNALDFAFERYTRTASLIGTPATCMKVVSRLRGAGVDEMGCLVDWMPPDALLAGLPALNQLKEDAQTVTVSETELLLHCKARLPDYMVPRAVMVLQAMPVTPNGKIDRRALPTVTYTSDPEPDLGPRNAVEQKLAHIWSALLGRQAMGIHDNFFDAGGDSILAVQAIARARAQGLHFSPKQLFQYPTIAELAPVITHAPAIKAEQGPVHGDVPLTPIQHWFFGLSNPVPGHFNQSMVLHVHELVDVPSLRDALSALTRQHDALRLRHEHGASGWRQYHDPRQEQAFSLQLFDPLPADDEQAAAMLQEHAQEIQSSGDLARGPLLRVGCWHSHDDAKSILLLVCHHLVIDGLSWRILVEDLQTAYAQRRAGQTISLPSKTTSYQQWSRQLHELAANASIVADLPHWAGLASPAPALPFDHVGEPSEGTTLSTHTVTLDAAATESLLRQVPVAYRTQINDALLTALALTLSEWTGRAEHTIHLEGHGREDLLDDCDVSRTVGWFTALFPVRLRTEPGWPMDQALKSIKEGLRAIPHKGISHGLLRHLARHPELASATPDICFNYLGQADQVMHAGGLFELRAERLGHNSSPRNRAPHPLEINAVVTQGCLHISFDFESPLLASATVHRLANRLVANLQRLITHCSAGAQGYTPSDFPLAQLTQNWLDAHFARHDAMGDVIDDIYPLTPIQQGVLFHGLMSPASGTYIQQMVYTLEHAPSVPALKMALAALVARHAVLRSSIAWQGLATPLSVVHRHAGVPVESLDLGDLTAAEQGAALQAWLAEDRARGFELDAPPLMRFAVIRLSDNEFRLVWTAHYLLFDGWSFATLQSEFMQDYRSLLEGQPLAVRQPPRPFRDHVAWIQSHDMAAADAFWQNDLAGFAAPTPLMLDRRHPDRQGHAQQRLTISARDTAALTAFAASHGLTMNTVTQGIWAIVLGRLSQQEDVVFGCTVSGRTSELADIDTMVGLFVNTLPVRTRVPGDAHVVDWMRALQAHNVELRQFESMPLTRIQALSALPTGAALFDSIVVFENFPVDASLKQADLPIKRLDISEQTNYPLTLIVGVGTQWTIDFGYDRQRFDEGAIALLADAFATTVAGIAADAHARLAELPLLNAAQQRQLLIDWNDTRAPFPHTDTLASLFAQQARRSPQACAVVFEDQRLSYAQLDARANQLAHHLIALGVRTESVVALCMDRSIDLPVAMLAVLKAGAAYLPLDPSYPKDRLAFMIEDAQPAVLISQQHLLDVLPASGHLPLCLADDPDLRMALLRLPTSSPPALAQPHNLAYLIYTSGSTGRPKGVAIEHRSAAALMHWARETFSAEQRAGMLACTSVCFDLSVFEIFTPLCWGGQLILVRNALDFVNLADKSIVTFFNTVPSAMSELVKLGQIPSSVLVVGLAGEPLHNELVQRIYRAGVAHVFNLYGPSEDTTYSTFVRVPADSALPVTIGRPLANTRLYVLDAMMRPVPQGVAGELYIGGQGLARHYLRRPGMTASRFVPDPFGHTPGARLYRTGDLVRYRQDAQVEFLGRIDHQVKVRGYRIELGEIEATLLRHPLVRETVVIARQDLTAGATLVAYLACQDHAMASADECRAFLRRTLPEYMVPSHFVVLPSLPLTPNGKIDRQALPAPDMLRHSAAFVAPSTPTQQRLSGIWKTLLGADDIGLDDNFFDLGGHSLLAMSAYGEILEAFPLTRPLAMVDLFTYPTLRSLAARLDDTQPDTGARQSQVQQRAVRQKAALQQRRSKNTRDKNNV